ncbi:hypothetical protein PGSY75_0808000 [Plasmodium gaboni]|uniref:Uncharacterized protein n=1 Tax=Plasmodium gaboni TaxID=647221 RepID=A0A151LN75_9APIC|nr:hypothetical protein PGSY75_0808000 [Plasmodium gaboni]KYO00683.1 hypothetical protein PGSY75_0808000 [Plasmodium gaboni]
MKISNYIFGRIIDSYSYVDKIKEHLEFNRIRKHFQDANILDKFLNNYKRKIEYYREKIKTNVLSILRKNYISFDNNVDDDLIFVNRYVYYEIKNEECIMICRKRLKRNFFKKNREYNIGKKKEYIENKYIYDYCYNSLDELKKDKYISTYKSEIVVIFPSYFYIKHFKILRDYIFSFIIERNDKPLNFCYMFKGTLPIYDMNIKQKIDKKNIPYILKNISNEQLENKWNKKKKRRSNKKFTNIELNNDIHLDVDQNKNIHNNIHKNIHKNIHNNIHKNIHKNICNNNKRNNIFRYSNFIVPIINKCIFIKEGISNVEFLNISMKDIFFFTTHINKKYRCNQLFLNGPKCFKKLIYEEKEEEYFLNLYKSKDEKKIFLLSGSHFHNKLFLLNLSKIYSKKIIIKNNYLIKQRKHVIIDMIKLISCRLRGKCFLENFYEHIIIICQGERNHVDIFFICIKDINYLIKRVNRKKYNNNEKKKKNIYHTYLDTYDNNMYNKLHFCHMKYKIKIRKFEIPIDSKIKKLATLKNCNLQDFDMTKYGLVIYLYKYFLTPFICILYLKNIYINTCKKTSGVLINNNNNNNYYNYNNNYYYHLMKMMKIIYLPIKKGSMSCSINNNFYSPFISFDICNTFINNIKLQLNLKKGFLCLSKNINKIEHKDDLVCRSSKLFESIYFKYDKEMEQIFELHKNFCIKDIFLKTTDNKKIAITLVYKSKDNDHICYDNYNNIRSTTTSGMNNINDCIKRIFDNNNNYYYYEKGDKNKKDIEITNFFDYIINEEKKINIDNNKMWYDNNNNNNNNNNIYYDNNNNNNICYDNNNNNICYDNNNNICYDNNFVDDLYSHKYNYLFNDFPIIFHYNLLSQMNMETYKIYNIESKEEKNHMLLPHFIYPSKTIIHVYPFYNEMNLSTYNDEYYFYLLNNFVISYFHLRDSGGLLYDNNEQGERKKFIYKTKEKKKIINDFMHCINFLKYKNISNTEKISLYVYSNCGMIGGYILGHKYKILKNIIFFNPLLDIFNNLTDCNNPHVPSEYLEFGSMNINDYNLKKNIHIKINNNSDNKINGGYNKKHKRYRKNNIRRNTKYSKERYLKGIHKNVRNDNNKKKKYIYIYKYIPYYYLYTMCPYYNISPNYKEHYCNNINNINNISKEVISFNNKNTNMFFKNNILLYLNKNDIICSNYNSIKYFIKYINHKNLTINYYYYYYDHHYDDNGENNLDETHKEHHNNKVNFINFKNNNENEKEKQNFYISFSNKGGHSGYDSSSAYLNTMLDKIYLHFFIN